MPLAETLWAADEKEPHPASMSNELLSPKTRYEFREYRAELETLRDRELMWRTSDVESAESQQR